MKTRLSLGILAIVSGLSGTQAALACEAQDMRWAQSSNSFYINGPVTCTLSDIAQVANPTILEQLDAGSNTWILRANLRLTEGAKLNLHGSAIGGDVDQLRLASPGLQGDPIFIRAHWGSIDIRNTSITSWDESIQGPQLDDTGGRSYIHVRSFLDGSTPRESSMDITDSDIGYLGYHSAEAYGLTWKVMGHPSEQPGLYDLVNVGGSMRNSNIHHNYMGFYSYGAEAIDIINNNVHNNISYGIDPHDDSDYLNIIDNHSHHNGRHGIICSRRCDHLTITGNHVNNNLHGIMLHREVVDTLVDNNKVHDNKDTGIVLFESHNNKVTNNEVYNNKNGIRLSLGSHDNLVENNTVRDNQRYGLYFFKGSDQPETTDGRPRNNTLKKNLIANHQRAIKITDADDNVFDSNIIKGPTNLTVYNSKNNRFIQNEYQQKLVVKSKGSSSNLSDNTFEVNQDMKLHINTQAKIKLVNQSRRVFRTQEDTGTNHISSQNTKMEITFDHIGKNSLIKMVPLWATPNPTSGNIKIEHALNNGKRWVISQESTSQSVSYIVGDLTPGQSYQILRNSMAIETMIANENGDVHFTDSTGTMAATTYELI